MVAVCDVLLALVLSRATTVIERLLVVGCVARVVVENALQDRLIGRRARRARDREYPGTRRGVVHRQAGRRGHRRRRPLRDRDSTASPSGRAVSVTVNEVEIRRYPHRSSVPTGAISSEVCSVNAVVTSLPVPPAFRSTTGAASKPTQFAWIPSSTAICVSIVPICVSSTQSPPNAAKPVASVLAATSAPVTASTAWSPLGQPGLRRNHTHRPEYRPTRRDSA